MTSSLDESRWVPLAQAASLMGVSTDTVRRRVKQGVLQARKASSRSGPAWLVRLADDVPLPPLAPDDVDSSLVALLGQLNAKVTLLAPTTCALL